MPVEKGETLFRRFLAAPLAIVLLGVTACATSADQNRAADSPSTGSPGATATPRPTDSQSAGNATPTAPNVEEASLPSGSVRQGASTVYSDCETSMTDDEFGLEGEVFNPATGRNVSLPVPDISGKKLIRHACTVGGDKDNIRVFRVVTLLTPSTGLTPESEETSIFAYDPFGVGDPQVVAWPDDVDIALVEEILPTDYGFIAYGFRSAPVGFDGSTLEPKFNLNTVLNDRVSELMAVDDSAEFTASPSQPNFKGVLVTTTTGYSNSDNTMAVQRALEAGESQYEFLSAKDGKLQATIGVGARHSRDLGTWTFPDGYLVQQTTDEDDVYKFGYFNFNDNQFTALTGLSSLASPAQVSVWGDKIAYLSLADDLIKVLDLKSGETIFEKQGIEGLNIERFSLAGNYLYILNDSDNPVIDITNSEQVSAGWSVRPSDQVGEDWTLVQSDGSAEEDAGTYGPASTSCFAVDRGYESRCYDADVKLVHSPGGVYPGPWF